MAHGEHPWPYLHPHHFCCAATLTTPAQRLIKETCRPQARPLAFWQSASHSIQPYPHPDAFFAALPQHRSVIDGVSERLLCKYRCFRKGVGPWGDVGVCDDAAGPLPPADCDTYFLSPPPSTATKTSSPSPVLAQPRRRIPAAYCTSPTSTLFTNPSIHIHIYQQKWCQGHWPWASASGRYVHT